MMNEQRRHQLYDKKQYARKYTGALFDRIQDEVQNAEAYDRKGDPRRVFSSCFHMIDPPLLIVNHSVAYHP